MSEFEEKVKAMLDSPEAITKIISAAQALSGNIKENNTEEQAEAEITYGAPAENTDDNFIEKLDPKVVSAAMEIMGEYKNSDDRRIRLLQALRSYFKDGDQVHITKAIQIVKLSKVAKKAFRSIREEDSFV